MDPFDGFSNPIPAPGAGVLLFLFLNSSNLFLICSSLFLGSCAFLRLTTIGIILLL